MPAPFPGLSWSVLFTLYISQKEELNALAVNRDTCSHLALCLRVMALRLTILGSMKFLASFNKMV